MSEPFVFDSRCTYCKEPYGAVECGTRVFFRCRMQQTRGDVFLKTPLAAPSSGPAGHLPPKGKAERF